MGPAAATIAMVMNTESLTNLLILRSNFLGVVWCPSNEGAKGETSAEVTAHGKEIQPGWRGIRSQGVEACQEGAREGWDGADRVQAGVNVVVRAGWPRGHSIACSPRTASRRCCGPEVFPGGCGVSQLPETLSIPARS